MAQQTINQPKTPQKDQAVITDVVNRPSYPEPKILRMYRDVPGMLKHNEAYRQRLQNVYKGKRRKWKSFPEKDSYGLINDSKSRLINNILNKKNINPLGGFMDANIGLYPPKLALTQYKNRIRFFDILFLLHDIYIDVQYKKKGKSTYYYWLYTLPTSAEFVKSLTSMMGLLCKNTQLLDKYILDYPYKDKDGATQQFVILWKAFAQSIDPKNIVKNLQTFLKWVANDLGLKTAAYSAKSFGTAQKYMKSKKKDYQVYNSIPAIRYLVKERSRASYMPIVYLGLITKAFKDNKMPEFKKLITKYKPMLYGMWLTYPVNILKTVIRTALGVDPKYAKDPANVKRINSFYTTVKNLMVPPKKKKVVAKKDYSEKVANLMAEYLAKIPKKTKKVPFKLIAEYVNKTFVVLKKVLPTIKDIDFTKFIMHVISLVYKRIGGKGLAIWGRRVKRILLLAKARQMRNKAVVNISKVLAESGMEGNQLLLAVMDQMARVPKTILLPPRKKVPGSMIEKEPVILANGDEYPISEAFKKFCNAILILTKKNPQFRASTGLSEEQILKILKDARNKVLKTVAKKKPKRPRRPRKPSVVPGADITTSATIYKNTMSMLKNIIADFRSTAQSGGYISNKKIYELGDTIISQIFMAFIHTLNLYKNIEPIQIKALINYVQNDPLVNSSENQGRIIDNTLNSLFSFYSINDSNIKNKISKLFYIMLYNPNYIPEPSLDTPGSSMPYIPPMPQFPDINKVIPPAPVIPTPYIPPMPNIPTPVIPPAPGMPTPPNLWQQPPVIPPMPTPVTYNMPQPMEMQMKTDQEIKKEKFNILKSIAKMIVDDIQELSSQVATADLPNFISSSQVDLVINKNKPSISKISNILLEMFSKYKMQFSNEALTKLQIIMTKFLDNSKRIKSILTPKFNAQDVKRVINYFANKYMEIAVGDIIQSAASATYQSKIIPGSSLMTKPSDAISEIFKYLAMNIGRSMDNNYNNGTFDQVYNYIMKDNNLFEQNISTLQAFPTGAATNIDERIQMISNTLQNGLDFIKDNLSETDGYKNFINKFSNIGYKDVDNLVSDIINQTLIKFKVVAQASGMSGFGWYPYCRYGGPIRRRGRGMSGDSLGAEFPYSPVDLIVKLVTSIIARIIHIKYVIMPKYASNKTEVKWNKSVLAKEKKALQQIVQRAQSENINIMDDENYIYIKDNIHNYYGFRDYLYSFKRSPDEIDNLIRKILEEALSGTSQSVSGLDGWGTPMQPGVARRGTQKAYKPSLSGDCMGNCGTCTNPFCVFVQKRMKRSRGLSGDVFNIYCDDHVLWNPETGTFHYPKKQETPETTEVNYPLPYPGLHYKDTPYTPAYSEGQYPMSKKPFPGIEEFYTPKKRQQQEEPMRPPMQKPPIPYIGPGYQTVSASEGGREQPYNPFEKPKEKSKKKAKKKSHRKSSGRIRPR